MTPRARAIIREIAEQHGVPFEKIVKPGRVQKIFRARMAAAIRLRAETRYSLPQIGRLLGCDHTMVLYYLGRLKKKPSKPRWRKPKVVEVQHVAKVAPELPKQFFRYAGFDPNEYQVIRYRHTNGERA